MASRNNNFIFMLIPILIFHATILFASAGLLPFSSKHVIIFNRLITRATLVVHCRNKGDDKGVISLGPGDSFDFRFRVNLRKTTVYTCSFVWTNNTATFDIFRADRDDNPRSKVGVCSECIWSIYELVPCRDRRDGGQPYCFPWTS
ncbi:S-protein homolog 5-like [Raphanus sativus]|uniref:S-protein homolog n=1 Tax=Raphanus sativus TaxID=3726 RepID=A0A6J0LCZ7_RAPSA|nr:S-protein homolog 5-like [Raphanus sativus]